MEWKFNSYRSDMDFAPEVGDVIQKSNGRGFVIKHEAIPVAILPHLNNHGSEVNGYSSYPVRLRYEHLANRGIRYEAVAICTWQTGGYDDYDDRDSTTDHSASYVVFSGVIPPEKVFSHAGHVEARIP